MNFADKIRSKKVAAYLLQIEAVKLSPDQPFTWASGWKSPIYCDNRKTLSFPEIRNYIRDEFAALIKSHYPDTEVIAGVATGAIAQGALVADKLGLPFVYVRSEAKQHGLENKIEGVVHEKQKVVIIEDLISTGGSSLKAHQALESAGCQVKGMLAIFTYGFDTAVKNFHDANCELITLSNYQELIIAALETDYIKQSDVETLNQWRESPDTWGQKFYGIYKGHPEK